MRPDSGRFHLLTVPCPATTRESTCGQTCFPCPPRGPPRDPVECHDSDCATKCRSVGASSPTPPQRHRPSHRLITTEHTSTVAPRSRVHRQLSLRHQPAVTPSAHTPRLPAKTRVLPPRCRAFQLHPEKLHRVDAGIDYRRTESTERSIQPSAVLSKFGHDSRHPQLADRERSPSMTMVFLDRDYSWIGRRVRAPTGRLRPLRLSATRDLPGRPFSTSTALGRCDVPARPRPTRTRFRILRTGNPTTRIRLDAQCPRCFEPCCPLLSPQRWGSPRADRHPHRRRQRRRVPRWSPPVSTAPSS